MILYIPFFFFQIVQNNKLIAYLSILIIILYRQITVVNSIYLLNTKYDRLKNGLSQNYDHTNLLEKFFYVVFNF